MTSLRLSRSGSYSSRSISSSSSMSQARGMQLFQGGQTRISTGGSVLKSSSSVYGGAGGFGTRISQADFSFGSGSINPYSDTAIISNEKGTMQNLNDRLATYLDKVRSLEAANRKLELQIREFYEKRTFVSRDLTGYYATITDLQAQITRRRLENNNIILQLDNAQLAADDFKMKYETEMNMRAMLDADLLRYRGVRDTMTLNISDLELQIEGLKEELAYTKSNHQEELRQLRVQQSGNVNVEVDSSSSMDLLKALEDMREYYETVVLKNKQEVEKWFEDKMSSISVIITGATTEVKTYASQLAELKRTYQSLEISRQSAMTEYQCMQQNLEEVNGRYSVQLSQLQVTINLLEEELQLLRVSIEQQKSEYSLLLDIKMRLELEIAEYRRLLEGELIEKKTVIISKTVEEHKPHVERRVKTIVEEIVDGRVVSSSTDTQVQEIS